MYGDNIILCYMDTYSLVIYVKTDDFYKDISNDINKWFDTSNYSKDINRPLEKGKNKKVIDKFKDELGGKVISEFCAVRAKTYAYRLDDGFEEEKAKGTKKCIIKNGITFNDYVNVLFNDTKLIKSQFGFRSNCHEVYTEKINKIVLSSNDDKRIQASDKINTFPYGYYDTTVIIENVDDTNVNTENIDDTNVNREIIIDISVNTEIINDSNVNTENIEGNFEYIEVIDNDNSPYIDFVPDNVVHTENVDTTSAHTKIIDDDLDNYREDIHDTPLITEIIYDPPVNNNTKILKEKAQALRDDSILLRSSHIPSPDWLFNQKLTINPKHTKDNMCFLISIVAALNHQNIDNNPQRIVNLIPFITNYKWNDINFPAGHKDYSAFEKNNSDIALNILFIPRNTQEIRQACVSKHNKTRNIHAKLLNGMNNGVNGIILQ